METERIARAFIDRTLAKAEFTHEAHLRVGLWHVLHHPGDAALDLLRARIRAFNESVGGANTWESGYHETITRLYVRLIRAFLDSVDACGPIDALAQDLIGRFGDRDLPLRFFSQERLFSVEARLSWVEPDLEQLPGALGSDGSHALLRVTYLQLTRQPPPPPHDGDERVAVERLAADGYLALYRRVGGPWRWDERLRMPPTQLGVLRADARVHLHVLRAATGEALGFCEFDHRGFPDVEIANFGLIPEAQGRGLGPYLLLTALQREWASRPGRIWLHTDTWDHPAAERVYQRAGFEVYDVRWVPARP